MNVDIGHVHIIWRLKQAGARGRGQTKANPKLKEGRIQNETRTDVHAIDWFRQAMFPLSCMRERKFR